MGSGKFNDKNANANYEWTDDMNLILDKMRMNCIALSDHHKYRYTFYKDKLILFRFPIILLSGVNTFVSVGLTGIADQMIISISTSIISLICGIITSLELYLNFQKKMESELMSHKEYYRLSVEIFKVISLDIENRKVDGKAFLEEKFSTYEKLLQSSNVVEASYIISTLTPTGPVIMDETNLRDNDIESQKRTSSTFIPGVQSITQPHLYKLKQKNKDMAKSSVNIVRTTNTDTRRNNRRIEEMDKEINKYKEDIEELKNSLAVTVRNNNRTNFFEGQQIEGNYRGRGRWYPGIISGINRDGTYNIDYDDGEIERFIGELNIRVKDTYSYSSPSRDYDEPRRRDYDEPRRRDYDESRRRGYNDSRDGDIPLEEGTKIEANYRGRGKWYRGIISRKRANGTFDIDYEDGEKELGVDSTLIRKLEGSPSLSRGQRNDRNRRLEEGMKVEANYRGRGKWFPAVISRERANDTFDIIYDDGDRELGVDRYLIRHREDNSRRRSRSPSQETTDDEITIGTKIEARFKGTSKWYAGKINNKNLDGTYNIIYDDGDIERHVKRDMIRKKEDDIPPPLPKPAAESESTEADSAASAASEETVTPSEDTAPPAAVEVSAAPVAEVNAEEGG